MATLSAIGLPALWRQAKAKNTTAAIKELQRRLGTRLIRATLARAKLQAKTGSESCHGPNSHSHTWHQHLRERRSCLRTKLKTGVLGPKLRTDSEHQTGLQPHQPFPSTPWGRQRSINASLKPMPTGKTHQLEADV
nr:hypothetical protein [Prochlorococcus marinus]